VDERSVVEEEHRRNRHDLEASRSPWILIDVQLAQSQAAAAGSSDLLQHRSDPMAWAAPLGPEVDQDRSRLANLPVERRVRKRDGSCPRRNADLRGGRRGKELLELSGGNRGQ